MVVVKDGRADSLAPCLATMLANQNGTLAAIEPLWQKTSYLQRTLNTGLFVQARRMADNGAH